MFLKVMRLSVLFAQHLLLSLRTMQSESLFCMPCNVHVSSLHCLWCWCLCFLPTAVATQWKHAWYWLHCVCATWQTGRCSWSQKNSRYMSCVRCNLCGICNILVTACLCSNEKLPLLGPESCQLSTEAQRDNLASLPCLDCKHIICILVMLAKSTSLKVGLAGVQEYQFGRLLTW